MTGLDPVIYVDPSGKPGETRRQCALLRVYPIDAAARRREHGVAIRLGASYAGNGAAKGILAAWLN
jgi:hypothetical protein